jgi:acylphosphatase
MKTPRDARQPAVQRLDASVHGRVQGVGFRMFVGDVAARLGLGGWVANESDGSVRCVVEGPLPALLELRAALEAGPRGARVDRVTEAWGPATGSHDGFRIRSGSHRGD